MLPRSGDDRLQKMSTGRVMPDRFTTARRRSVSGAHAPHPGDPWALDPLGR